MDFDDPYWQRTDEQMAMDAMDWDNPAMEGISMDLLKEKGFARLKIGTPDTYLPHAEGNFLTPSGKCEFKASAAENGNFVVPLFRQGSNEFQPGTPVDPLPHYIPPNESLATNPEQAAKYPLNMLTPKSHAFLNSNFGNLPKQIRHAKEQFVMMHPQDASARGITEGSIVRAYNERGAFEAVAQLNEGVRPGVVVAPMGYWRNSSRSNATVNVLTPFKFADMGNAPTFSDSLVEITTV